MRGMRVGRGLAGVIFAAALGSCGRDPVANFTDSRIEALCGFYERCDTLMVAGYKTATDCRTQLAVAAKSSSADMLCEDFSQGQADACVAAWEEADCETPPDLAVCEDVCSN